MLRAWLFSAVILLSACQSPTLVFSGKALKGIESTTESFSFAEEYATLQLEVNPPRPYSVILRTTVLDNELYIDAAASRKWGKFLQENSNVRIKLGERVYPASAVQVLDEAITSQFLSGRTIYRIDPIK